MSAMLTVLLLSTVLVVTCFYLHYFALRVCVRIITTQQIKPHRPLLFVLVLVFVVHLLEVNVFAMAYYLLHWSDWLGTLVSTNADQPQDYAHFFYFSISSYTTLGIGDLVPTGGIRIVAGVEALAGLVLIAWTASFSYLMMERLWKGPNAK